MEGGLIDPESLLSMRNTKGWVAAQHGVIAQEFFKWLGNTSEDDLRRLAVHLLNAGSQRSLGYPKVTMKTVKSVLLDCYSTKEWLERTKRKHAVRKYLHLEKPSLGFFSTSGSYRKDKWKAFKEDYCITAATKQVLLIEPGELFFCQVKKPSTKNMPCRKLSQYAAEFFKVFLQTKGDFIVPEGKACFWTYDMQEDTFNNWEDGEWDDDHKESIKLGIMDFRNVPGVMDKDSAPEDSPYYQDFLERLKELEDPSITDPEVWLWITGDKTTDDHLRVEIRCKGIGEHYIPHFCQYVLSPYKRMNNLLSASKKSTEIVNLIFLVRKLVKI